jgi:hypothetical protein
MTLTKGSRRISKKWAYSTPLMRWQTTSLFLSLPSIFPSPIFLTEHWLEPEGAGEGRVALCYLPAIDAHHVGGDRGIRGSENVSGASGRRRFDGQSSVGKPPEDEVCDPLGNAVIALGNAAAVCNNRRNAAHFRRNIRPIAELIRADGKIWLMSQPS